MDEVIHDADGDLIDEFNFHEDEDKLPQQYVIGASSSPPTATTSSRKKGEEGTRPNNLCTMCGARPLPPDAYVLNGYPICDTCWLEVLELLTTLPRDDMLRILHGRRRG